MANPLNVALGPDAQVNINSVLFNVVSGTYKSSSDVAETTDSNNGGVKWRKNGLRDFECSLEAQLDSTFSPHVAPLGLDSGFYVHLELFPFGVGNLKYDVATFLIESFDGSFTVKGSEPQKIKFSGKSSGFFELWGENGH